MIITIEDSVPPPKRRRGPPAKWDWVALLEVGQSVFVPAVPRQRLTWAGQYYAKKLGGDIRFECQKERNGARIWRTA